MTTIPLVFAQIRSKVNSLDPRGNKEGYIKLSKMCKSLIQCLLVAAALRVMLLAVGVGGVGEESGVGEGSGAGSGILQAVQDRQFSINVRYGWL